MRKEIEVLKDHSHFSADLFNVLDVVGEFDAVHHNPALLVFFETIDAANEGGFP
jgi:hypothetical protein